MHIAPTSAPVFRTLFLLVTLTLAITRPALAQEKEYLYEIGGGIGMSWGYGDVNTSKVIYSPSTSFGLVYRYNVNLRWALAAELQSNGLSGDTRDFGYASPTGLPHDYSLRTWQLGFRPEIHFWNYGLGSDYREKRRYTPFLTAGLTMGLITGLDEDKGTAFLGIPLGVGYKLKMAKRWNAQLTALFTKTFSDKLDGWADPTGIQSNALVGNDWMAAIHLSVTFDFKERCIECHNQKN